MKGEAMLDDLKYIHEKDTQDALGIAEKQYHQLRQNYNIPEVGQRVENIVVSGMGGSALAALLSSSWPGYSLPFEIVRNYDIPSYVSEDTLFIASSYSGNTEETLEALSKAEQKGAYIVVVASGGKLAEIANKKGYGLATIPGGMQPRYATLYNFRAIITILQQAGLLEVESVNGVIDTATEMVRRSTLEWRADVKTDKNIAKQLALELSGSTPVIYAGPKLYPAAYKWKISFNENAKNVAWCGEFPEFNHNEFLGWTSHPIDKPYKVIQLISSLEHPRTQKRFKLSNTLLSGRWPQPIVVEAKGRGLLEQLLYMVALGDFVSIYLALLNGLNPTPVDIIEKLKAKLET